MPPVKYAPTPTSRGSDQLKGYNADFTDRVKALKIVQGANPFGKALKEHTDKMGIFAKPEDAMDTTTLLYDPDKFNDFTVKAWVRTLSADPQILTCVAEVDKGIQVGMKDVNSKPQVYMPSKKSASDFIANTKVDGISCLTNIAEAVYRLDLTKPDWTPVRTECAKTGFQLGQIKAVQGLIDKEEQRQKQEAAASAKRAKEEAQNKNAEMKLPTVPAPKLPTVPAPKTPSSKSSTSVYLIAGAAAVAIAVGIGAYLYLN